MPFGKVLFSKRLINVQNINTRCHRKFSRSKQMENNWLCNPLCHRKSNIAFFGLRLYVQRCVPIRAWAPISVPSLLWAVSRTRYRSDAIHASSGFSALAQRRYSKEKLNKTSSGADISNHRTSEWCDYSSSTCSNAKSESAKPSPRTSSRDSSLLQRMKRVGKQQWTHL